MLAAGCNPRPESRPSTTAATHPPQLSYSTAQADRGRRVYLDHCVLCHGTTLSDAQFGSPLRGGYFQSRWHGRNAAELFIITQATMPPEQPMSLAPEEYADVLAYVLQANEIMAGAEDFPADTAALQGMLLPW